MKLTSPTRNDFDAVSMPEIRTAASRDRNGRIVMGISFAATGPAVGEHIGIEQIRGSRARAVVEGRTHRAIGQFQSRGMPGPDRLQTAGRKLGNEGVLGNALDLGRC